MSSERKVAKKGREILILAVAFILLGVLFLVFPRTSLTIICTILGGVIVAFGIVRLIFYFKEKENGLYSYDFAKALTLLAVGVIVLIRPKSLAAFITIALGIVLLADGIIKLQYAMNILREKAGGWLWILIVSLLAVALGIIAIVNPFRTTYALMRFIGIILIINGIADLVILKYVSSVAKKLFNKADVTLDEKDYKVE